MSSNHKKTSLSPNHLVQNSQLVKRFYTPLRKTMETQKQERSKEKVQETETQKSEYVEPVVSHSPVPSAASSPSHEFSFTVSQHTSDTVATTAAPEAVEKAARQPLAIDLSPADDIFFHGHLLPLHFLSHLHALSPRSSANSLDSFTLPINTAESKKTVSNSSLGCNCEDDDLNDCVSYNNTYFDSTQEPNIENISGMKERSNKHKPFSLFGLGKWRKPSDAKERPEHRQNQNQNQNHHQQQNKKVKFDMSQFLKRYVKMVKPLLSLKGDKIRVRRQSYSFTGTLSRRDKSQFRGRRGEFSAPASMRTSPTNSGLLLATSGVPSPASDSTMEELQAAIQAAIAHCKNSIAAEGKKPQDHSLPVI